MKTTVSSATVVVVVVGGHVDVGLGLKEEEEGWWASISLQTSFLLTTVAAKTYLASSMLVGARVQVLLHGSNCSTEFRTDDPL